jgi:hypothetical protein
MVAVLHWEGFCWVACWASFVGPTYGTLKDSEGLQMDSGSTADARVRL